jgi:hypothetical protein
MEKSHVRLSSVFQKILKWKRLSRLSVSLPGEVVNVHV